jgi:hypothetical protein
MSTGSGWTADGAWAREAKAPNHNRLNSLSEMRNGKGVLREPF